MIFTLAARELRSLFMSPLAWVVLTVAQTILAYSFLLYLDYFTQIQPQLETMTTDLGLTQVVVSPLLATASIVLMAITPLITMRLISEERRNQTLSLLFSAPISMLELVLGKFLGVLCFFLILLLLLMLMPLSLLLGSEIDTGIVLAGFVALVLLAALFCSLGLYISSWSTSPAAAAAITFAILILLWMVDLAAGTGAKTEWLGTVSILEHIQPLLQGVVNSRDIAYFVVLTVVFLSLSVHRLNQQRLTHH